MTSFIRFNPFYEPHNNTAIRIRLLKKTTIYTKTTKRKEKFSHRELLDLMGVHRDTYKRVRGAIRRK